MSLIDEVPQLSARPNLRLWGDIGIGVDTPRQETHIWLPMGLVTRDLDSRPRHAMRAVVGDLDLGARNIEL